MNPWPALLPSSPPAPVRRLARWSVDIKTMAATVVAVLLLPPSVHAQSSCSSDGQRAPMALMERFMSADCAQCWSAAETPGPPRGTVVLDWIVPGTQGEDAPLSAAAIREATERLYALGRDVPQAANSLSERVKPAGSLRLRVALGPAVNGYVGASIELRQTGTLKGPVSAWLALVETIPSGIEGSPVERNLVRNVHIPAWNGPEQLSISKSSRLIEARSMSIPPGANPERLRVVGWVEDKQGIIRVIAQSRCAGDDQR